jgi:hypothetical protein
MQAWGIVIGIAGPLVQNIFLFLQKRKNRREDQLLDYLAGDADWKSPQDFRAANYLRTLMEDLQVRTTHLESAKIRRKKKALRPIVCYFLEIRHKLRRRLLPTENQIADSMRSLWKSGFLDRTAHNPACYRLKEGLLSKRDHSFLRPSKAA